MNLSNTIKTGALALAVVVITSSASMAAWMNQNSAIKANHFNAAPNVDWVAAGQQVAILNSWGQWYRINPQGPGPHGWVRKYKVDAGFPGPFPGPGFGSGQVCFGGPAGYVCLGN